MTAQDARLKLKRRSKSTMRADTECRDFLELAYFGLVLRGYDREREIPDAILRKVWRLGKRIVMAQRKAHK